MTGALTSSPIEREESINETNSTISSSDRSDRQTMSSPMTSASNTIATSFSRPPDSLRGQAQNDLHKLQVQLSAAKARGDTNAQKASLQQSMDVIRKAYLSTSTAQVIEPSPKAASPPKAKTNRVSLMPKKSISLLSMVGKKSKQTDLHEAARTGDIDTLRSLLEDKVNINSRGDRFKTPQMEAAMRSHLHCLETLKEFGADEFAVDAAGRNVLHMAVVSNQPRAVSWLIQAILQLRMMYQAASLPGLRGRPRLSQGLDHRRFFVRLRMVKVQGPCTWLRSSACLTWPRSFSIRARMSSQGITGVGPHSSLLR